MAVACETCDAENDNYEDSNGTYWFKCVKCGYENEVVYKWY